MTDDMDRLNSLVREIDGVVETVVSAAGLPDEDVRRVLRFVGQVVQVVEQAFQDVLGVLVEMSYLQDADLARPERMAELQKSVVLLTARSYYREAAEICSRLKHLGENFNEFVRPSLQHLPAFGQWGDLFGLIEHREGRIIMLVEEAAREIGQMLAGARSGSVHQIREVASRRATELRSLVGELHNLNGQILGYSGRAGFLELTANRDELQREVRIMVDKRDQSITHGHRVSVDRSTTGNIVTATSIQDSFKTIQASQAEPAVKQELQRLCAAVEQLLPHMPESKRPEVTQDLTNLVAEATKEQPRLRWYELSAEGLIEAAKTCGAIATPVIDTVRKVLTLLGA